MVGFAEQTPRKSNSTHNSFHGRSGYFGGSQGSRLERSTEMLRFKFIFEKQVWDRLSFDVSIIQIIQIFDKIYYTNIIKIILEKLLKKI